MEASKWDVRKIDRQFLEIIQHPICYCDRDYKIIRGKCTDDKLRKYMKRIRANTIYKLVLECPEIHHPEYRCPGRCSFKEDYPEIMVKVYQQLAEEKLWKQKHRY